jgi:hypothetical protein
LQSVPLIANTNKRLWWLSLILTSLLSASLLIVLLLSVIVPVFGSAISLALLFSLFALLGIWKESTAGRAFLGWLVLEEVVLLAFSSLGALGQGAISGAGFGILTSVLISYGAVIIATVVPFCTYTLFLNRHSTSVRT